MTAIDKKKQAKNVVRLTSREINVVSVIAQQTALPHEYLLKFARDANISPDAYMIVKSLLGDPSSKFTVKKTVGKKSAAGKVASKKLISKKKPALGKAASTKQAAGDFSRWAATLK